MSSLELIDTAPEALGTFRAASDAPLRARGWTSIELRYTVGSLGVAEGGSFLIAVQYQSDGGTLQIVVEPLLLRRALGAATAPGVPPLLR